MTEVVATDELLGWLDALPARDNDAVEFVVDLLVEKGVRLAFP